MTSKESDMFFKIIKDIEESDEQQVSYNEEFQLSKYAYIINNAETFKEMGYQVINEESVFGFDTVYLKRNKKVQPQPCEDCISRQTVDTLVNELARAISDERCFMPRGRSTTAIMQDILDLPPVTPQRPKGKWIVHPKGIYAHLVCSKCLSNAPYDCETNYCPNCGAEMEVEE